MDNFERDPRRQQEIRCRPYANAIYLRTFGNDIEITRFDSKEKNILDKEFAIDVKIGLGTGMILTGQEKFLSEREAHYNSVTVEYMQDFIKNVPGDWYKLAIQFYFVGYECQSEGTFKPWVILNWSNVVTNTKMGNIKWFDQVNKDGHARASFKYTNINNLPEDCVIARYKYPERITGNQKSEAQTLRKIGFTY